MGKGQTVPGDPLFYIAFIILLLMAIADNALTDAKGNTSKAENQTGAMGSAGIAMRGVFNQLFGAGDNQCLFLKDLNGNMAKGYPKDGVMANWQCILIFGMLPFAILYYFMFDVLMFTMISDRTRSLLALTIAIIALQLKMLVSMTNMLVNLTNQFLGGTTALFSVLIAMGIAGSVMGQLGMTMKTAADAAYGTGEVLYGLRTMRAIGKQVGKK